MKHDASGYLYLILGSITATEGGIRRTAESFRRHEIQLGQGPINVEALLSLLLSSLSADLLQTRKYIFLTR